ncbi:MAG: hypothetical protein R2838_02570 [Caldilineaceae bacterium]
MNIGSQSMVAPLRTVLVKDPRASHVDQATVDAQWQTLHYPDRPDLARVQAEYAAFFATLADYDVEIGTLPPAPETTLDSIYTHDPVAAVSRRGVILGNMGKAARRTEPDAMET